MRLFAGLLIILALAGAALAEDTKPDAPLTNTYWKLLTAGGVPAVAMENRREAHIILRLDGTVGGSTGCNTMTGSYRIEGETVVLGPLASTRMFCAETAETERAFTAALSAVKGWRVKGGDLTLVDAAGAPLATLTAVYF